MNEEEKKTVEELKGCIFFWQGQAISSDNEEDLKIAEKEISINKSLLNLIKKLQKENEELKEELKEENELNKIIKDTKLDKLFCERNGKKVESAIKLRDELLKLPECKLYGIKKCKKSVVLITKEEVIPVQKVKEKIEHYQKLQDNYIEKYDEINEGLQAMINTLQELLEGRE